MTTLSTRGRVTLAVLVWVGATVLVLAVAAGTKIGPIVVRLSYNHGVHLGDLLAAGAAYTLAALVTAALFVRRRQAHQNRK